MYYYVLKEKYLCTLYYVLFYFSRKTCEFIFLIYYYLKILCNLLFKLCISVQKMNLRKLL